MSLAQIPAFVRSSTNTSPPRLSCSKFRIRLEQSVLVDLENPSSTSTSLHSQAPGVSTQMSFAEFVTKNNHLGRPQRDGPALRSTTLIKYANYLVASGNTSYVTSTLWPVIQLDLDYVSADWNQTT